MTKLFTADTHFNHEAIAKLRGFADSSEHDAHLLEQINTYVDREDELFVLGDFALSNPQKYRLAIKCRHVHLIIGNHDKALASKNTFGDCPKIKVTKVCDQQTVLCHYPMAYWPNSHHGSLHLYGHMHGKREATLDNLFPRRRSKDVGVDNAIKHFGVYEPFNEKWLYNMLAHRDGHDPVDFYASFDKH